MNGQVLRVDQLSQQAGPPQLRNEGAAEGPGAPGLAPQRAVVRSAKAPPHKPVDDLAAAIAMVKRAAEGKFEVQPELLALAPTREAAAEKPADLSSKPCRGSCSAKGTRPSRSTGASTALRNGPRSWSSPKRRTTRSWPSCGDTQNPKRNIFGTWSKLFYCC